MHQFNKNQIPPKIQKHGLESNNKRRLTLNKAQHGAKRHANNNDSSRESYKELSSCGYGSHFQRRRKRRKHPKSHEPEEFKKYNPPTFYGDIKKGDEAEAWILGLKMYFKVHDYENLKARIAILNLNGKASIWWEDLRNVKGIHEKEP